MSVLLRFASLRRLQVVLGLALMGLVFAPSASGAAQLDTVTAHLSFFQAANGQIDATAQSGTSGENPSGEVYMVFGGGLGQTHVSGPVTCLNVMGNTAIMNYQGTKLSNGMVVPVGIQTLELVDNGGPGLDVVSFTTVSPGQRLPTDCSPLTNPQFSGTQDAGSITIFDAPVLPTSKAQCKDGGWLIYPQFKNQGQCVSFVETGK